MLVLQAVVVAQSAFEVASVKPAKATGPGSQVLRFLPGGRLEAKGMPLYILVATAWNVASFNESKRLTGAPAWTRTEIFDIEAAAPVGAVPAELPRQERDARIRLMLRALLQERFGLRMRTEMRELPVYAIAQGKGGIRLPASKRSVAECDEAGSASVPPDCHQVNGGMGRGLHGKAVNVGDLGRMVENWTDRPVVDKTGVTQLYEVNTEGWAPMLARPVGPDGLPAGDAGVADPDRQTVFQVFEQMGLKLEPQKSPVEIYVMEKVDRLAGN